MGGLFSFTDDSLAVTEQTLRYVSGAVVVYSLAVLVRGIQLYRESDYIGILVCGLASKFPQFTQRNVSKRLAALMANLPGVVVPLLMHQLYMRFPLNHINNTILTLFMFYYVQRLILGVVFSGYAVNMQDVLLEFGLNMCFGYGQSASVCYLYEYGLLNLPFYVAGMFMYIVGSVIYVYHEYKLKSLEVMFHTRIPYYKGAMFKLVVAPQCFGEIVVVAGLAVMTLTITGITHVVFLTAYYMVIANLRYVYVCSLVILPLASVRT